MKDRLFQQIFDHVHKQLVGSLSDTFMTVFGVSFIPSGKKN